MPPASRPACYRPPSAPAISTTRLPHCPTHDVLGLYKKPLTLRACRTRPPHNPIFCRHSLRHRASGVLLATLVDVARNVYPLRPKGHGTVPFIKGNTQINCGGCQLPLAPPLLIVTITLDVGVLPPAPPRPPAPPFIMCGLAPAARGWLPQNVLLVPQPCALAPLAYPQTCGLTACGCESSGAQGHPLLRALRTISNPYIFITDVN